MVPTMETKSYCKGGSTEEDEVNGKTMHDRRVTDEPKLQLREAKFAQLVIAQKVSTKFGRCDLSYDVSVPYAVMYESELEDLCIGNDDNYWYSASDSV